MHKSIFCGALVVALTGCTGLDIASSARDRAGNAAADVVWEYCDRTSVPGREALRQRMDERTAPHTVRVECDQ